ncbi:hypothetical protein NHX12_010455 [Muraenolepis orangiensis]|uniref:Uncharacterized protein n=1 Tax=Muraenolepis orangiensis TaxID=630683 RepID=A0A9Q0DM96_9TELE|nr:hypothetical protein NHX12_010455 [Muraenolepis orangiensis]
MQIAHRAVGHDDDIMCFSSPEMTRAEGLSENLCLTYVAGHIDKNGPGENTQYMNARHTHPTRRRQPLMFTMRIDEQTFGHESALLWNIPGPYGGLHHRLSSEEDHYSCQASGMPKKTMNLPCLTGGITPRDLKQNGKVSNCGDVQGR